MSTEMTGVPAGARGYAAGDHRHTEVLVHRAGAIGNKHVPTLAIIATDEIPEDPTFEGHRTRIIAEGNELADALLDHLPQGVIDRILLRLLEHRASLLRIAEPMSQTMVRAAAPQMLSALKLVESFLKQGGGYCPACDVFPHEAGCVLADALAAAEGRA